MTSDKRTDTEFPRRESLRSARAGYDGAPVHWGAPMPALVAVAALGALLIGGAGSFLEVVLGVVLLAGAVPTMGWLLAPRFPFALLRELHARLSGGRATRYGPMAGRSSGRPRQSLSGSGA